jgi:hypothetical protein
LTDEEGRQSIYKVNFEITTKFAFQEQGIISEPEEIELIESE